MMMSVPCRKLTPFPADIAISSLCRRLRIPVNVADSPTLCTFTLLSTHTDGPIQIGVTTSGRGCKLASRIKREVASSLPADLGAACARLGSLRRRIYEEDHSIDLVEPEDEESGQRSTFNALITPEDLSAVRGRRMRWLSQICEYWPLARLAAITDLDIDTILLSYVTTLIAPTSLPAPSSTPPAITAVTLDSRRRATGRIILAGSGPGNPDLLTTATLKAILAADLILADKLVPAPVLALVPRRTPIYIARKFPGNAEKAQEELLAMGLEGLREGKIVVRLKQGDPYIYGRGAEEYAFFHGHGFEVSVLPGITSALSAPLFAAIPATHRAVADQVLICTGTGRKGAAPDPPVYNPHQTVVFLMSLHRLSALITSLARSADGDKILEGEETRWPRETPCAVIERASCPDQRVIRSTLASVEAAIEEEGSRPPGLLVVGWACGVLWKGEQRWVVEDGFRGLDGIGSESLLGFQGLQSLPDALPVPDTVGR